jgi:broad specificity phosphatase PhoE
MFPRRSLVLAVCALLAPATLSARGPTPTVVVLVRHAERAATPADDPVLTEAGRARADALRAVLADARVDAIITTHYERTRKTAEPLAKAAKVAPVIVRAGADTAAHVREVAAAVRGQPAAGLVVVVGHSNTIPPIIAALGGPTLPDLCDAEYARLFTLVLPPDAPPHLIQSFYGAADPVEPCGRTMSR